MKKILGCLLAMALLQNGSAQGTRYIVSFRDKGSSPYSLSSPGIFLSQRALDRRTRYQITLDSTDLPVTPRYIDSVRLAGTVTVLNASKWLNSVSIQTNDATAIAKINSFPFVRSVTSIATRSMPGFVDKFSMEHSMTPVPFHREMGVEADHFDYGTSYNQVHIHNGEFLHNIGLRGQTMIIGMLDAGYNNYLTLSAFDSVRANGQILETWDFVNREASVNEDFAHGMECFSTIAANIPGQFVGTAPKASFFLYRSEDAGTEYPIEEHNWVCAAERVDSAGGDLISSSLGYNTFDPPYNNVSHTYADMNGNTTMAARGADLAAKKGILVVNSAGNEGTNGWHYIITPADGDSVMAVGAVNASGAVANFSSYGPSSDGQVKPDVASVGQGTIVQYSSGFIGGNNGTSFSCPNLAGLTACLWQGFPEFNNMKIISTLRKAGSKANNPDDRVGYGIPDVKKALMMLVKEFSTASVTSSGCQNTITWTSKDMNAMKYEIERKLPGSPVFTRIGVQNGSGSIFNTGTYLFNDQLNNVPVGIITYRIRQIIDTASATLTADYIDTVSVNLSTVCGNPPAINDTIFISPNPARNKFTLSVTTGYAIEKLTIRIFNAKGQLVAETVKDKLPGTALFEIPTAYLAAGKYFVTIYNGQQRMATKELLRL